MADGWIPVTKRLPQPNADETGSFGAVEVIVQCNPFNAPKEKPWQVMRIASCDFIGRDPTRPLWMTAEKPHTPVENVAWFVTHWRPFPKFPNTVKVK